MQKSEVRNWLAKHDTISCAYIRIRCILLVPATTMASYEDFERGVIVDDQEMGYNIYEKAMEFRFSCATILRVHHKYRVCDKPSVRSEKEFERMGPLTDENTYARQTYNSLSSVPQSIIHAPIYRVFQCCGINKCQPANSSKELHWYDFHSYTNVDCTAESSMPWLHCLHRHWTTDDGKHVFWSNESHFQLYRSDGSVCLWREYINSWTIHADRGLFNPV